MTELIEMLNILLIIFATIYVVGLIIFMFAVGAVLTNLRNISDAIRGESEIKLSNSEDELGEFIEPDLDRIRGDLKKQKLSLNKK